MESAIKSFLECHPHFEHNLERNRVVCKLTRHEIPCRVDALEAYVKGKKYQQITGKGKYDGTTLDSYKEFLVPSKRGSHRLYCTLTKKEINNIAVQIEHHVTGRRFQKVLAKHKQKSENQSIEQDESDGWETDSDSDIEEQDNKLQDSAMAENEHLVETGIFVPSDYESEGNKSDGDEPMELDDVKSHTVIENKMNIDSQPVASSSGVWQGMKNTNKRKTATGSNGAAVKKSRNVEEEKPKRRHKKKRKNKQVKE